MSVFKAYILLCLVLVGLLLAGCEAAHADRPTLYAFTSASCGPCQQDKPWLNAIRNLNLVIVLVVDTDADPATTQAFGVTSLPRYIIVTRGHRFEAGQSAQSVYQTLVNARDK